MGARLICVYIHPVHAHCNRSASCLHLCCECSVQKHSGLQTPKEVAHYQAGLHGGYTTLDVRLSQMEHP